VFYVVRFVVVPGAQASWVSFALCIGCSRYGERAGVRDL
jgi:hypothetical protein